MATACLIAFFFVGGWLVPIDPSFFQSSTSVLILLLTTDWLDPFLSGMLFLLSYNFLFCRFAVEMFLVSQRVGAGQVDHAVAMIRRRVQRIKLHGHGAGVDDVVRRPGRRPASPERTRFSG